MPLCADRIRRATGFQVHPSIAPGAYTNDAAVGLVVNVRASSQRGLRAEPTEAAHDTQAAELNSVCIDTALGPCQLSMMSASHHVPEV